MTEETAKQRKAQQALIRQAYIDLDKLNRTLADMDIQVEPGQSKSRVKPAVL